MNILLIFVTAEVFGISTTVSVILLTNQKSSFHACPGHIAPIVSFELAGFYPSSIVDGNSLKIPWIYAQINYSSGRHL